MSGKRNKQKRKNEPQKLDAEEIIKKTFVEKYRYVGIMGDDRIVVEDRLTGEQLPIKKLSGEYVLVEYDGLDSCVIYSKTSKKFFTLYNSNRYEAPSRSARVSSANLLGANDQSIAPSASLGQPSL